MASGTFFDMTLYKRALRRWWPLGLAVCAAMAYQCMDTLSRMTPYMYGDANYNLMELSLNSPLAAVFACAAAMLCYRYLHAVRDAAFMAALPVHRSAVFLSQGAAALTLLLAGEVLCAVLVPVFSGTMTALLPAAGHWLAITAVLTAAYFGFASLCAVLTGHTLAVPALYALGLYAAVALEASVRTMAQFLIFGLGSQQWKLTALSPVYYLKRFNYALLNIWVSETDPVTDRVIAYTTEFLGKGTLCGYFAAGCVCLLLAVALLKNRPAEAAGDVIAVRVLRPVFRAGAALAGGCAGAMLLLRTVLGYSGYYAETGSAPKVALLVFILLLGGFVGWFGADMLLRKTLRVFDRHWAGYGVWAALAIAAVLGCKVDLFRVERSVPEESKIGFVTLSCYEAGVYETRFEEAENIAAVRALHKTVVDNKALFEQSDDPRYVSGGMGYYYGYHPGGTLIIRYYDKAGRRMMFREYTAPAGELAWSSGGDADRRGGRENPALAQLEALVNTPEAVEERSLPYQGPNGRRRGGVSEGVAHDPNGNHWGSVSYSFQDALGYYRFSELAQLNRREVYELFTQAMLPDFRDSSLGYIRLRPAEQQTLPELGNVMINLGLSDGEMDWYWYGSIPADAGRTIAWLNEHGMEIDPATAEYIGPAVPDDME